MKLTKEKLKCYVLTVAQKYPANHRKVGRPTNFVLKIKEKFKIHTIRSNYNLWKYRIEEINAGRGYLSIRIWTGKPYKSKQLEVFRFHGKEVGIEKIKFINMDGLIEDKKEVGYRTLAINDGLKEMDYLDWFKKSNQETMAIIHFTEFRYNSNN